MILYEGEYSGVLKPERHYVPLRKDHSNMADVVAILRDESKAQQIIQRAYEEVALNPDYWLETFVTGFDAEVAAAATPGTAGRLGYDAGQLGQILLADRRAARKRRTSRILNEAYRIFYGVILGYLSESQRDRVQQLINPIVARILPLLSSLRAPFRRHHIP